MVAVGAERAGIMSSSAQPCPTYPAVNYRRAEEARSWPVFVSGQWDIPKPATAPLALLPDDAS